MNIKVYSPIDGTIGKIEELADGIFSEKMLGDGFFVRPLDQTKIISFYSPIETGKVQFVADTKHAFFFDLGKETNVLMHIGLDTVKLDGKPFSNTIEIDKDVNLDTKIVDVDCGLIQNSGLDTVCPITINSEKENYEFRLKISDKNVKAGELVGEFILVNKKEPVKIDFNNNENLKKYFSTEDTYSRNAKVFNKLVGTQSNYDEVYNCMTRLRFKIKNKDLVNIDEIKKIDVVKGIVWNGNELQIIIGQDVYKYKEQVSKLIELEASGDFVLQAKKNNKGLSLSRRAMQVFSGIMIPLIPLFVGTGLIQVIASLLSLAKVMPDMNWNHTTAFEQQDWWWVLVFTISKAASMFCGIIIAGSASKYFGLRLPVGLGIGVTLCAPCLFTDGGDIGIGPEWKLFYIHHFDPQQMLQNPVYFALDKILNPSIECCEYKILVIILTIYVAKLLEDSLLKVIPPMIEITVRPFLTFLISCTLAFIIFLPIWNIFEGILCLIFCYVSKIPWGIGVGIYSFVDQVAVTFGMQMLLGLIGGLQQMSQMAQGGYQMFSAGGSVSVYAMLGAMLGLMIITKNAGLKAQCKGLIVLPFLGITEPILYGIAVPRKKTYWSAMLGAGVAGCYLGALKCTGRISTGMGLTEIIGYFCYTTLDPDGSKAAAYGNLSAVANGFVYISGIFVAMGAAMAISMLLSEYRKDEKSSVKKTAIYLKKEMMLTMLLNKMSKDQIKSFLDLSESNFKNLKKLISKEESKKIKVVEKQVIKLNKAETKLSELLRKETALKDKLGKKGAKFVIKENFEKAKEVAIKISEINNEDKIKSLKLSISSIKPDYEIIDKIITEKIQKVKELIGSEKAIIDLPILNDEKVINSFHNALNEMRLEYKVNDSKSDHDFLANILMLKSQIKEEHKIKK